MLITGDPNTHSADFSTGNPLLFLAVIPYSKRQFGYIRIGIHCVRNTGICAVLAAVCRRIEIYCAFVSAIYKRRRRSICKAAVQKAVVLTGFFTGRNNIIAENSNELFIQAAYTVSRGICGHRLC